VTSSAEAAVRRYLSWLDDPSSIVDAEAVAEADAAFTAATDPMARLHAAADRERASATDTAALEAEFIAHASDYAAEADLPVSAFSAVGVSDDLLRRAGFSLPGTRAKRSAARGARTARASQVSVSDIQRVAIEMADEFTLAQLAEKAGGSPATVRKAVSELMIEGKVLDIGPDRNAGGPGRAPTLYRSVAHRR
jgi:hypothetical protein